MPFNPLDPLGLFKRRSGGGLDWNHTEKERVNPLDPLGVFPKEGNNIPPDPLGLFKSNPGRTSHLPPPPDPLGLFKKSSSNPAICPYHSSGATIGNPIPIEFNGHLVDEKTKAREKLIAKGYTPQRVDMALKWAEEWLMGMARRMAPGNLALQKSIVQSAYAEIADRAESWIRGIEAAFFIGAPA